MDNRYRALQDQHGNRRQRGIQFGQAHLQEDDADLRDDPRMPLLPLTRERVDEEFGEGRWNHIERQRAQEVNDVRRNGRLVSVNGWMFTFWGRYIDIMNSFTAVDAQGRRVLKTKRIGAREIKCTYLVAQLEQAPDYSRQNSYQGFHWQGYCEFDARLSFPQMLEWTGWGHIEPARIATYPDGETDVAPDDLVAANRFYAFHLKARWSNSNAACIHYCRRLDKRYTVRPNMPGQPQDPAQAYAGPDGANTILEGEPHAPAAHDTWNAVLNTLDEERSSMAVLRKHPEVFIRYNSGVKDAVALLDRANNNDHRAVQVFLHWGATGTGKTRRVFDKEPDLYRKISGQWFDGYEGQPAILFDEFYGQWPISDFLMWLDTYPLVVNVRGSTRAAKWTRVYITSNRPLHEWYPHATPEQVNALRRRIPEENRTEFKKEEEKKPEAEDPTDIVLPPHLEKIMLGGDVAPLGVAPKMTAKPEVVNAFRNLIAALGPALNPAGVQ